MGLVQRFFDLQAIDGGRSQEILILREPRPPPTTTKTFFFSETVDPGLLSKNAQPCPFL